MRGQYHRLIADPVAGLAEAFDDDAPGFTMSWSCQIADIFQNEESGLFGPNDLHDVKKQGAPGLVTNPFLCPRFGEGLTGKSGTKNTVIRDEAVDPVEIEGFSVGSAGQAANVLDHLMGLHGGKCGLVNLSAFLVQLDGQDASSTQFFQGMVKTTNACE